MQSTKFGHIILGNFIVDKQTDDSHALSISSKNEDDVQVDQHLQNILSVLGNRRNK